MSAAYSGHMKVVELLLEKGARTDAINNVSSLSYLVLKYYTHVNCLLACATRYSQASVLMTTLSRLERTRLL